MLGTALVTTEGAGRGDSPALEGLVVNRMP